MSVLHSSQDESDQRATRIRDASILEMEKIVKLAKGKGLTLARFLSKNTGLLKIEIMILDS